MTILRSWKPETETLMPEAVTVWNKALENTGFHKDQLIQYDDDDNNDYAYIFNVT